MPARRLCQKGTVCTCLLTIPAFLLIVCASEIVRASYKEAAQQPTNALPTPSKHLLYLSGMYVHCILLLAWPVPTWFALTTCNNMILLLKLQTLVCISCAHLLNTNLPRQLRSAL